jgi:hypothetical protein
LAFLGGFQGVFTKMDLWDAAPPGLSWLVHKEP